VSWQATGKANKWQGVNRGRWRNYEYDRLFRASEEELDPIKRTALLIAMNDLICREHAIIPVVYRPSMYGLGRQLVAPLSGWDSALSSVAEWYAEA
jgi:peptide/nickel transport system substrate-binding protein